MIGESRLEEQLDKALTRAQKRIEKQLDADADGLRKELEEAEKAEVAYRSRLAGAPVAGASGPERESLRGRIADSHTEGTQ